MLEYRRDVHHIRQVVPAPRVRVAEGNIQVQITVIRYSLQCFDNVGWATGRTSGP